MNERIDKIEEELIVLRQIIEYQTELIENLKISNNSYLLMCENLFVDNEHIKSFN